MIETAGSQPKSNDEWIYRIKGMAAVRLCAEFTVLLLLLLMPLILLLHGDFWKITVVTRTLVCIVSAISLGVLPFYASLPYKVKLSPSGISTISLLTSQIAEWDTIRALKLKTSWGWRRYHVVSDVGDVSFPLWLCDLQSLVSTIRERLPNRGYIASGGSAERIFRQDLVGLLLQGVKLLLSILFVAVFWTFAFSLIHHKGPKSDPTDSYIILAAGVVFTVIMMVRIVLTAVMPRLVELKPDCLRVETVFFKRDYPWEQLKGILQPWFFLPDGILVKTKASVLLIGADLDSFDELQEALSGRLPQLTSHRPR